MTIANFAPRQLGPPRDVARTGAERRNAVRDRRDQPCERREHLVWLVDALYRVGVDPTLPLAQLGVSPTRLDALGSEIPLRWLFDVWEGVAQRYPRAGVGQRIARRIAPDQLGTFGELLTSSATLANALLVASRFTRLLSSNIELQLHVHGDQATLVYLPRFPELSHPEMSEFVVTALAVVARNLSRRHLVPTEVRFTHSAPPDTTELGNFFGAPVKFDQPHHGYVFPSSMLQCEVVSSKPAARREIESRAQQLLQEANLPPSFSERVLSLLQARLRHGEPSSVEIAGELGLHPKTLNRRLRAEGTNYQRLLNQLRQRLAEHYLRQPDLAVSRVAHLLGYSENSAFCRAFKRWTGSPPQDFRRITLGSS